MTCIDKLLIQGIRSFSPQNRNIIEFYKPLTIIVGANGAGKTTIIECLKYSCTGEMPPNAKNGQAFVHDPKIAGEREVKAQIKLRFRSVNGKPIVCTRSLQLTQKAAKQEMKTLEAALQTYNQNNEKVSQSYRCADIDKEIPELMGVSKPVLESVIFCHQEESNWPLSDSSTLKKKFDEIFAATRYTKALEVLKKEKKTQAQQVKEFSLRLQTAQEIKESAHKVKKDVDALKAKVEQANEEIKHLKDLGAAKDTAINQIKKRQAGVKDTVVEIQQLRAAKQQMIKQNQQTYEELTSEFTETDEELRLIEKKFNQEIEKYVAHEKELAEKIVKLEQEKVNLEKKLFQISDENGQIKAAVNRHQDLLQERDRQLIQFTNRYNIPGFSEGPFSSDQVKKILIKSKALLQQLKDQISNIKNDFTNQSGELEKVMDKMKEEHNQIKEKHKQSVAILQESEKKHQQLTNEMKQKQAWYGQLDNVQKKIIEEQEALIKLRSENNADEISKMIDQLIKQKQGIDAKIVQTAEVMKGMNLQANQRAKLNLKKTEKKKREDENEQLIQSNKEKLRKVVSMADPVSMKKELERSIATKKVARTSVGKKLEEEKKQATLLSGQLKTNRDLLAKLTSDAKENEKKVTKHLPKEKLDTPLSDLIKEAEAQYEKFKKDMLMLKSAEIMYQNYIKKSRDNHECPLCERSFGKEEEITFLKRLADLLGSAPKALKEKEERSKEAENMFKGLKGVQPFWDLKERLEKVDIPEINSKIEDLTNQLKEHEASVQKVSEEAVKVESEEQDAVSLVSVVDAIVRNYEEISKLGREVDEEEKKLMSTTNERRTIEEVTAEYEKLQRESAELNAKAESLRKESQSKSQSLITRESQLTKLKEEALSMKGSMDEINRLRTQVQELSAKIQTLPQEIKEYESKMHKQQSEMQEHQTKRQKLQDDSRKMEEDLQAEKDVFQSKMSKLENLEQQLAQIAQDDPSKKLERLALVKKDIEGKLENVNSEIKSINENIDELRDQVAQRNTTKRNIQDNIKYREQVAAIKQIEIKIKEKEQLISASSEDMVDVDTDLDKLVKEYDALKSKHDRLVGARNAQMEEIKKHEKELSEQKFRAIDEEYRQMLIELKTTEMAHTDLDKYYKALEKALMKYHAAKMEEINKIIKELWQSTYKGADIDTIAVRSDVESATGRTSYNYRLVMIKGDTELDMRGRCSAGQKVLASLITRLALAETFCINCGILALDEPTTNLDRNNVESFANALVNIIETRRQQSNFQLVIITHDEEFVSLIGKSEHADYYWRVSKDQNGHSIIERQDIADL